MRLPPIRLASVWRIGRAGATVWTGLDGMQVVMATGNRRIFVVVLAVAAMSLGGCISTAAAIVKAPFQMVGQTADWATTSQDESDRNYGRKMRKQEAREGRELRKRNKELEREARRNRRDD